MPRIGLAFLLAGALALAGAHATVYATDVNESPECQRLFQQMAEPLLQQLLWFTGVASQYPLTPQGRPVVTGWPYSAYGPGNGYGPGSAYGPAFGPWGAGAFAPGAGTPALFGGGALGPGGSGWQFARTQFATSRAGVNGAPPGLTFLSVANGINAFGPGFPLAGGLGAPGTADLIALSGLQQGEVGNALAAQGLALSAVGNAQGGA